MSLANIRAEYKTQLQAIANVGVVHDYPRLATDWKAFLDKFKDAAGKIRGWEISIESSPGQTDWLTGVSPNRIADVRWIVLLRGYFGIRDVDATAKTFDDLIEAVLAKFRPLFDLNGKALRTSVMTAGPIQERDFGGVLCHFVEMRQEVFERVTF